MHPRSKYLSHLISKVRPTNPGDKSNAVRQQAPGIKKTEHKLGTPKNKSSDNGCEFYNWQNKKRSTNMMYFAPCTYLPCKQMIICCLQLIICKPRRTTNKNVQWCANIQHRFRNNVYAFESEHYSYKNGHLLAQSLCINEEENACHKHKEEFEIHNWKIKRYKHQRCFVSAYKVVNLMKVQSTMMTTDLLFRSMLTV